MAASRPVRGSRSGRPIMAALDLLGRRWALRLLWELRDGPRTFRALREKAEQVLGESFRIRAFHDALMAAGPATLPVLEQIMDEWLAAQSRLAAA